MGDSINHGTCAAAPDLTHTMGARARPEKAKNLPNNTENEYEKYRMFSRHISKFKENASLCSKTTVL